MEKELQGLEERPEMDIHLKSLKATLKKAPNWKILGHYGIHGFCFKSSCPSMTDYHLN